MANEGAISVTGLFCYPIKSCAGTALDQAEVEPRGMEHDREFMLIDARSGIFLTQRELPRMALIQPELATGSELRVSAPGMPELVTPVRHEGGQRSAVVWHDRCPAIDQGEEAARWFSSFLEHDCRLVRMAEDYVRRVDPTYAVSDSNQVGFADGFPFLLVSQESLDGLNARLAEPLPMDRFRPNIVIAGSGEPFFEDRTPRLEIGAILFHLVKPCSRCVITTTDQRTALRGREPLATLATFRRTDQRLLFGQNLIHEGCGTLHLGDPVIVPGRTSPC